jgi:hypothetical protein
MRERIRRRAMYLVLALLLLAVSELALAAAGKVLFVSGPVSLERGGTRPLNKGDAIEAGDIIVTGEKGRAQLLMADGARIALRTGSRFRIDEFSLRPPSMPRQAAVITADGRSVATLLRATTAPPQLDQQSVQCLQLRRSALGIVTDYAPSSAPAVRTSACPGRAIRDGLYLPACSRAASSSAALGGRYSSIRAASSSFGAGTAGTLAGLPALLIEDGAGASSGCHRCASDRRSSGRTQ